MAFENILERAMTIKDEEKTFIDKMLAKKEADRVKVLFLKKELTREEIMELLYYLAGIESKLLNYDSWERYVQLKYHIWIQEYIKNMELLFDYQDELEIKENTCSNCDKLIDTKIKNKCECTTPEPKMVLTKRTQLLLRDNKKLVEHNVKFLIGLYSNIGKTSLSVNAVGIKEILKQRFELDYGTKPESSYGQKEKGLFRFGRKQ